MKVTEVIIEGVARAMGGDYTVEKAVKSLPNGETEEGVVVRKNDRMAPVIYCSKWDLDDEAEAIEKITKIAKQAEADADKRDAATFDIFAKDRAEILKNIIPQAVNTEASADFIAGKPATTVCDLSIIYRYALKNDENGLESVIITDELAAAWDLTEQDLRDAATDYILHDLKITSMADMLAGMLGDEADLIEDSGFMPPMLVATTHNNVYGAAVVMVPEVLQELARRCGGSCYILPSSIHEVLAVPCELAEEPQELAPMIGDINADYVQAAEVLAGHAYKYSLQDGAELAPVS